MLTNATDVRQRVEAAIADIRAGKIIILVDDEDRENEGDLTVAAELVTPEAINFMATHGRGIICLALTEEQVERLGLPMIRPPGISGPPLGTAFTVSVEAREGVTTGVSAADRARTVRVVTDPRSRPTDIVSPGHVFPLKAQRGGVLVRTGQTEGAVDLARLAGLTPAGVICEVMNADGAMARTPDLERFSRAHGLRIATIADLIQYRLLTERLVRRTSEATVTLGLTGTEWRVIVYESPVSPRQYLALVKGRVAEGPPPLCRVHTGSTWNDVFGGAGSEAGRHLRESIEWIENEGRGALVYIAPLGHVRCEIEESTTNGIRASRGSANEPPLRDIGLGAQVLADLGIRELRLLTSHPRRIAGIEGFGLHVVERVALPSAREVEK
ncbi:MAG: 3,4-dihydroxy-2-butanone-4-phosphate synthase [Polyangiaceae bacterium]|jgi:3,4-dihydroxy 2-butanone 4-phosphate synthase/GTP cyclohydrolase II